MQLPHRENVDKNQTGPVDYHDTEKAVSPLFILHLTSNICI